MERPGERRDLIFVGIVEAIGPPPRVWGGPLGAFQEVVYRVERTITGPVTDRHVAIRHAVVRDSPLAEPGEAPGLSTTHFAPGSRLVVMAVRDAAGPWYAPSEQFGAMPHSRLLEEHLVAAARSFDASAETVDFSRSDPPAKG